MNYKDCFSTLSIVNLRHPRPHFYQIHILFSTTLRLTFAKAFTACMDCKFSCCVSRATPRVSTCLDPIASPKRFCLSQCPSNNQPTQCHEARRGKCGMGGTGLRTIKPLSACAIPQITLNDKTSIEAGTPKELKTEN